MTFNDRPPATPPDKQGPAGGELTSATASNDARAAHLPAGAHADHSRDGNHKVATWVGVPTGVRHG
jgi:hypothetical protein